MGSLTGFWAGVERFWGLELGWTAKHNCAVFYPALARYTRRLTIRSYQLRNELKIDHEATFPHLPNAPIVEAVLHWQAAASKQLSQQELKEQLEKDFPGYEIKPQHSVEAALRQSKGGFEIRQRSDWDGLRLIKSDGDQQQFVCQFTQSGIVFSRLKPYLGWDELAPEARKFWNKYVEIAKPNEIGRLGVRYISQINIESTLDVDEYIERVCLPLNDINLHSDRFFHQDTIRLTNHPYTVNLVRAVQEIAKEKQLVLIVDIDVSTNVANSDFSKLDEQLKDLRYIKNKVFFTYMNDAATKFGVVH